jgi:chemotaxis protein methyltransferase CheR
MEKFTVRPIPDDLISDLSEVVRIRTGLHFPREKWHDLRRGVCAAASDFGFDCSETCARWLLSASLSQKQMDLLVGRLTIGETFFFRDKKVFQALREHILSRRFHGATDKPEKLNFWSAGCCTGEEPYSVAILMDQLMSLGNRFDVAIIGTDINPGFIQKARDGVYTRWSFRETPDAIMDRYFVRKEKNRFEILPRIKKMVEFNQLNLAQKAESFPDTKVGAMDVIFCRNVLMYFSSEMRAEVINRLTRSLKEGGWLILSPSETPFIQQPDLSPVKLSGTNFFRKGPPRKNDSFLPAPGRKSSTARFRPVPSRRSTRPASSERKEKNRQRFTEQGLPEQRKRLPTGHALLPPGERRGNLKQDRYGEALELYDRGLYRESVEEIERLLAEGSQNGQTSLLKPEHMALMAKSLANLGKLEDAGEWATKAVKAERLKPDHHYLLATICQEQGRLEESMKLLKQTLYLDPEFVMAYVNLANIMKKKGEKKGFERYSKNALSLLSTMAPDEAVPHSEGVAAEMLAKMLSTGSR